jgi:hypothetical protein
MAGDNRTPEKTIGEVRYAALKHDEELHNDNHGAGKSGSGQQKAARKDADQQPPKGGDNRTPDKTIGEVKYAQARQSSKSGAN